MPRVDGHAKVRGQARYAAEWPVPGLAHGAVVDSAIARGTVRTIDAAAALAAPGVIVVVTHENAPRLGPYPKTGSGFPLTGEGGLGEARQPLQDAAVHYGGQSIAVVVCGVYDCDRLINPTIARSQLMDWMLFGLGAALCEETVFDSNTGMPVVREHGRLPHPGLRGRATDFDRGAEHSRSARRRTPCARVGEMGTNGVPPAIGNAIYNVPASVSARRLTLPTS